MHTGPKRNNGTIPQVNEDAVDECMGCSSMYAHALWGGGSYWSPCIGSECMLSCVIEEIICT